MHCNNIGKEAPQKKRENVRISSPEIWKKIFERSTEYDTKKTGGGKERRINVYISHWFDHIAEKIKY